MLNYRDSSFWRERFKKLGFLEGIHDSDVENAVVHNMTAATEWMEAHRESITGSAEVCCIPIIRRITTEASKFVEPPIISDADAFFAYFIPQLEKEMAYWDEAKEKLNSIVDSEAQAAAYLTDRIVKIIVNS